MNTKFNIKFLSIVSIFLFNILKTNAQGYIPFPMDSVTWKILLDYNAPFQCWEQYLLCHSFRGDTIINSINYRIVYSHDEFLYAHLNGSAGCGCCGSQSYL